MGSDSTLRNPRKHNIGAIVGGVLGGLALICIIFGALFWMRRRRNAKSRAINTMPEPLVEEVPQPPAYYSSRSSVTTLEVSAHMGDSKKTDEKEVVVYKLDGKSAGEVPVEKSSSGKGR